jgi:hypothetical protein
VKLYILSAPAIALAITACSAAPEEESASTESPVTCGASLERYPVAGPHNGGYDKSAATFTCGGELDNSDYYTGAGGANHRNGHLGNDIFGARGTPIVVAQSGVVVEASFTSIGGNNVVIRDDCGWSYYYAHLDSIDRGNIAVGRRVGAGSPVGTLGDTGQARGTQPHLHFSVYPNGNYSAGIDPFPLLDRVVTNACGAPANTPPPFEATERPTGGDFEALHIKSPIGEGLWITQCNESRDGDRVWQTTAGGPDPDSRWAKAMYPQEIHNSCGDPSPEGIYPLIFRSVHAGELGTWVAQCTGSHDGHQAVYRTDAEIDGHPAAVFLYVEPNDACR